MADSFKPDAPVDSFKPDAETKSIGGFVSNAFSSAGKFASDVGGAIAHPINTLKAIGSIPVGLAEKAGIPVPAPGPGEVDSAKSLDALVNHYKQRYGSWDGFTHALYTDPVGVSADVATLASGVGAAGKGVQLAADAAKFGKVADVAGTVAKAGDAVSAVTDPLRVATSAAGGALKVADKVAPAASDALRRSALKGGYTITADPAKVADAATAMREQGIPLSEAGSAKISTALNDLQQAKLGKTSAGAAGGLAVDPARVQLPLDDVRTKYANQVNPTADLKQIDKVADTFRQNNPGPIPLDHAEALKEGTYKVNNYGPPAAKNTVATADAEKALASGLREELEYHMPELKGLNEQQAKLMNLQGILDKAVTKYTNSGGFLGSIKGSLNTGASKTIGMISGGALASGHAAVGAAGGAADLMMAVLSDPVVKSRLATAIDLASKANPTKWNSPRLATGLVRVEQLATGLSRATQQ
jgi:hypothetical protein